MLQSDQKTVHRAPLIGDDIAYILPMGAFLLFTLGGHALAVFLRRQLRRQDVCHRDPADRPLAALHADHLELLVAGDRDGRDRRGSMGRHGKRAAARLAALSPG